MEPGKVGMTTPNDHGFAGKPNCSELQSSPKPHAGRVGDWLEWCVISLLAVITLAMSSGGTVALEIEFSGRTVKRDILALYDGRRERVLHETRIHKFAEMPLNYLGYRLVYHDVNTPLPEPSALGRYRGVLTWLIEPLRRPDTLVDWLDQVSASGLKLVILGEVAPPDAGWLLPKINRVLGRIGLEHTGEYVDLTWRAFIVDQDPEVVGFERQVDKVLPGFPVLRAKGSDVRTHLIIDAPAAGGRTQAAIVATGPGGGYASLSYTIFYEPNTDRVRWTLNPFTFFKRAFGPERFPVPDTTTHSGRRIYFSHVDGDGWNNISEIEGHRNAQRLSAEVVLREAVLPYPDLPVTIGLIAGDTDAELGGNPASKLIARQLFALPQVEVASHTYTHPYDWQFFEHYDRQAELAKVEQYQPPDLTMRERFSRTITTMARKERPADRFDKWVATTDDLPRTYLRKPFDLDQEMTGALAVSESLAPAGKRAKIMLWSGDTTPFPEAIRRLRKAGIPNLNGGDSRLDREYPSVTYVPPISRPAGTERQIYSGNSNENTYTNDWTGPYYGYFMLEHTLGNTDKPRRLKPFNVYYHMYSGEKASALAGVKHFLEMARKSPVLPTTASHYARIADDYFTTEIEQVDLFSWAVTSRGALQTVRFDSAEQLAVDHARSSGVLGSNRHEGALLVALDPAVDRAIVTLRARAEAQAAPAHPTTLIESRWSLRGQARDACSVRLEAQGFGAGEMIWQASAGRQFTVAAERGSQKLFQETVTADGDGRLKFTIAADAIEPLSVRLQCHD